MNSLSIPAVNVVNIAGLSGFILSCVQKSLDISSPTLIMFLDPRFLLTYPPGPYGYLPLQLFSIPFLCLLCRKQHISLRKMGITFICSSLLHFPSHAVEYIYVLSSVPLSFRIPARVSGSILFVSIYFWSFHSGSFHIFCMRYWAVYHLYDFLPPTSLLFYMEVKLFLFSISGTSFSLPKLLIRFNIFCLISPFKNSYASLKILSSPYFRFISRISPSVLRPCSSSISFSPSLSPLDPLLFFLLSDRFECTTNWFPHSSILISTLNGVLSFRRLLM